MQINIKRLFFVVVSMPLNSRCTFALVLVSWYWRRCHCWKKLPKFKRNWLIIPTNLDAIVARGHFHWALFHRLWKNENQMEKILDLDLFPKCRLCGVNGRHEMDILEFDSSDGSHIPDALSEKIYRCVGIRVRTTWVRECDVAILISNPLISDRSKAMTNYRRKYANHAFSK